MRASPPAILAARKPAQCAALIAPYILVVEGRWNKKGPIDDWAFGFSERLAPAILDGFCAGNAALADSVQGQVATARIAKLLLGGKGITPVVGLAT